MACHQSGLRRHKKVCELRVVPVGNDSRRLRKNGCCSTEFIRRRTLLHHDDSIMDRLVRGLFQIGELAVALVDIVPINLPIVSYSNRLHYAYTSVVGKNYA